MIAIAIKKNVNAISKAMNWKDVNVMLKYLFKDLWELKAPAFYATLGIAINSYANTFDTLVASLAQLVGLLTAIIGLVLIFLKMKIQLKEYQESKKNGRD